MENVRARTTPAAATLALALVVAACASAAAQQAGGVTAVRNSYVASLANWDLRAVRAYCATWDADMPLA